MTDAERSHLIDRLERQRTTALGSTQQHIRLLTDGLHALRNGSPEVTEEFVERVLASLDRLQTELSA